MQLLNGSADAPEIIETLRPLGNYVLVRRERPEEKTKGGVLVPESVRREEAKVDPIAIVVAVGPGLVCEGGGRTPMEVVPGDRVQLLRTIAPASLEGHDDLYIVDIGMIFGVIEPA